MATKQSKSRNTRIHEDEIELEPETISSPKFSPLSDFVVAIPFTEKETLELEARKTKIALPTATEKKGRTVWARVIACGPGKVVSEYPTILTGVPPIGATILCSEYDSYEIRVAGQEFLVVRAEFIFTIFNK